MKYHYIHAIAVAIFVLVHSPEGDSVRAYMGQSKKTITALLTSEGKTGEFITEAQYKAFINTHQPARASVAQKAEMTQTRKDMNDKSKTPDQRLDALIKHLGLQ